MDVEGFLNRELEIRKETGFPPFSRMINIVLRSRNREAALSVADTIASKLRSKGPGFEVFGAQECALERVRNYWRFQVLVRSSKPQAMFSAVSSVLSEIKVPSAVILETDVDPLEML